MGDTLLAYSILYIEEAVATTYSTQTRDTLTVLAQQIAAARRERQWTAENLAQRAGISRVTLSKIEHGDPKVAIGTVFEVATLLGVPLFGATRAEIAGLVERGRERLALLPERVREPKVEIDDDF